MFPLGRESQLRPVTGLMGNDLSAPRSQASENRIILFPFVIIKVV